MAHHRHLKCCNVKTVVKSLQRYRTKNADEFLSLIDLYGALSIFLEEGGVRYDCTNSLSLSFYLLTMPKFKRTNMLDFVASVVLIFILRDIKTQAIIRN